VFGARSAAWERELDLNPEIVNLNRGGAFRRDTGYRLVVSLIFEMER